MKQNLKLNEFYFSFRVAFNSTESLYTPNIVLESTESKLKKFCECAATEQQSQVNSISDLYTANCSIATETVLCSEGTTTQSLENTCGNHQHRYKRKANDMDFEHQIKTRSLNSDDTIESQPLIIDPNFDPNFIPPVNLLGSNYDISNVAILHLINLHELFFICFT